MPEELLPKAPVKGKGSYTAYHQGASLEVQVSNAAFLLKKSRNGKKYMGKHKAFGWGRKGVKSAWKAAKTALGWVS